MSYKNQAIKRRSSMTKIINRFTGNLICEEALLNIRETAEKNKDYLKEANLEGADLEGADFWGDDLMGANLKEANLMGANLRRADLEGADLWGADLWRADLRRANLKGADLRRADLKGANLWGANLWGANLMGANLKEADLWRANLEGANLWRADLRGAKIACKKIVNYKEVSGIGNLRRQLRCFILEDGSLHFIAGCFSGTETELLLRVKEKYGNDCEYIDAINLLKQISIKYPWK